MQISGHGRKRRLGVATGDSGQAVKHKSSAARAPGPSRSVVVGQSARDEPGRRHRLPPERGQLQIGVEVRVCDGLPGCLAVPGDCGLGYLVGEQPGAPATGPGCAKVCNVPNAMAQLGVLEVDQMHALRGEHIVVGAGVSRAQDLLAWVPQPRRQRAEVFDGLQVQRQPKFLQHSNVPLRGDREIAGRISARARAHARPTPP